MNMTINVAENARALSCRGCSELACRGAHPKHLSVGFRR